MHSKYITSLHLLSKRKLISPNFVNYRFINNIIKQNYDHSKSKYYEFIGLDKDAISSNDKLMISERKLDKPIGSSNPIQSYINELWYYILPKGYPLSVREGYAIFIKGQMLSNVLSTIGGVLSMQSLLYAIGLSSGSIPLAASLNWIIKDGLGQLGGIMFASFVSNRFDANPKRWRFISTICMEISSFIELLTPLVPQYFLFFASIANIGKNISYLAASASRAAIHRSFSLQENLADITAKTGSQSIITSLVGTSLGISIASFIGDSYSSIVLVYCTCSSLSVAITYYSLQHVTISSLSIKRFEYLIYTYLQNRIAQANHNNTKIDNNTNDNSNGNNNDNNHNNNNNNNKYNISNDDDNNIKIMTPMEMKSIESFLGVSHPSIINLPGLKIGCDLNQVVNTFNEYENDNYLINAMVNNDTKHAIVHLLYKENASQKDILQGFIQSYLIRNILYHTYNYNNNQNIKSLFNISSILNKKEDKLNYHQHILVLQNSIHDNNNNSIKVGNDIINQIYNQHIQHHEWKISESLIETRYARII